MIFKMSIAREEEIKTVNIKYFIIFLNDTILRFFQLVNQIKINRIKIQDYETKITSLERELLEFKLEIKRRPLIRLSNDNCLHNLVNYKKFYNRNLFKLEFK